MAEGEKGFAIYPLQAIGGEVEVVEGGARCIPLVYELRRTRSSVQRVPWELILGHDTYREI